MSDNKMKQSSIGFEVPEVDPANTPKSSMTPESIIKWRSSLPMADIGAASKKLFLALSELNRTHLKPVDRFEVLELFRQPLQNICASLRNHYLHQTKPLSSDKLQIANLAQTLQTLISHGYKIVIEDLNSGKHGSEDKEKSKEVLAASIYRTLYYYNLILLRTYQLYTYPPKNIWKEIHLLYKFAEQQKISNLKVNCDFTRKGKTSNVLIGYTHILMFSATDPYQWRQNELEVVNNALDMWAQYSALKPISKAELNHPGIYIIDPESDKPPIPYNFIREKIKKTFIALDLSREVGHLKKIIAEMKGNSLQAKAEHAGDPEFIVAVSTMKRVISMWGEELVRKNNRFEIYTEIDIVFGFADCHYYLNDRKSFDPTANHVQITNENNDKTSSFTSHSSDLPTFEVEEDLEEDENADNDETDESTTEDIPEEKIKPAEEHTVYTYVIENISPSGFCVSIKDGSFPPVQAGEIIITRNSESHEDMPWSVGVVRWLRNPAEGIHNIGIELIAPYAKAAAVQILRDDKPVGYLLRCLLSPANKEAKQPPLLIMPTVPVGNLHSVMLSMDDHEPVKTNLKKEVNITGSFVEFTYSTETELKLKEPIERKVKTTDTEDKSKNEEIKADKTLEKQKNKSEPEDNKTDTEFDSIWDQL